MLGFTVAVTATLPGRLTGYLWHPGIYINCIPLLISAVKPIELIPLPEAY